MLKPLGLPNLGSTCYLNALIQALVGIKPLLDEDIKGEIFESLTNFAYHQKIDLSPFLKLLPKQAFDSHEALTIIMDYLPKDLFKLKYEPELITYFGSNDILIIQTPTQKYKLLKYPRILVILKNKEDKFCTYPYYKLVSFIDHLGAHYISSSLRNDVWFLFDDSSFRKTDGLPTPNTTILFYTLENPFQVAHPM